MNFKRVASGICALTLVCGMAAAPAQSVVPAIRTAIVASADNEKTYGDLLYKSDGKQITITGALNKDSLTSVVIPSKIEGLPVTTMKGSVFYDFKELRSVTIQPGLKTIETGFIIGNFEHCQKLTSVTLPNTLEKIDDWTFRECSALTSISIPDSVDYLGHEAFIDCKSLKTIKLSSKIKKIDYGTFENCEKLESVVFPSGIENISFRAFNGCKSLNSVTLPESLEEIYYDAFFGCNSLLRVNVPFNVKKIDDRAFGYDSDGDKYAISFGVYKGTEGERYARDNGFNYTYLNTSIANAEISVANKVVVYNGKLQTPNVVVKVDGKLLYNGQDYDLSFSNNQNCGKAVITVTGKDRYVGTARSSFIIKPKKVTSQKLISPKKKTVKLKWKKAGGNVDGYQVLLATNKKFKSGKKVVWVKKGAATAKTIKKLKSKKTYYAKVRAFKKIDGKKYYGAWSKIKKVKVK